MVKQLDTVTKSLVTRFERQRPMRGGSLIISVFGDAIAPRGGAITLGSLIALIQPFGLTERLVRTSVARLAKEGWLVARREGRLSEYQLSSRGRAAFADATRRIYAAGPEDWDGSWTLVLMPPAAAAIRDKLRKELEWLGFGQPTPGVFAHPARTAQDARARLSDLDGAASAFVIKARNDNPESDREFASAGWDLADLTSRYRRLLGMFEPIAAALESTPDPTPDTAFIIRTLLIHEYRKIHLRDPMLPLRLLPQNWIGATAYQLCQKLYSDLFLPAEEHLSKTGMRLGEPLPVPGPDTFQRFGGIMSRRRAG